MKAMLLTLLLSLTAHAQQVLPESGWRVITPRCVPADCGPGGCCPPGYYYEERYSEPQNYGGGGSRPSPDGVETPPVGSEGTPDFQPSPPVNENPKPATPPQEPKPAIDPQALEDFGKQLDAREEKSLLVLNEIKIAIQNQKGCECKPCDLTPVIAKLDALATSINKLSVQPPATGNAAPADPQIFYYDIVPRKKGA